MRIAAATTLLLALAALRPALAQDAPDFDAELGEAGARGLVAQFQKSQHWALRCVILSSLAKRWHPSVSEMLVLALKEQDKRLRAYAIEALRRADGETVRAAATKELLDNLITKQMLVEDKIYRDRVMDILKAAVPDGPANRGDWSSWWSRKKQDWVPGPWSAKEKPPVASPAPGGGTPGPGMTVAEQFVERAFDLNMSGLDIVICIDATGSMQPTIDAARDAVREMVSVLRGIAPKFRMGAVWYRDFDTGKKGAEILVVLSEGVDAVVGKLAGLNAGGGGDFEERVEKGLEIALSPAMGWKPATNKVVLIIGDAPPHNEDVAATVEMARKAREGKAPDGKEQPGQDVPTGPGVAKPKPRGIATSAIGVGTTHVAHPTSGAFRAIAEAGGGGYGEVLITAGGGGGAEKILESILVSSFGEAWAVPTREFVRIYLEYRKAKFFPS